MIVILLYFILAFSELQSGYGLKTNLLYITYDDLRTELSIYGRHHMITPNFERLAAKSVVFDYAFSQIAVCNPSRDSQLTGLRPDTLGTYGFQYSFRPNMIIPTYLLQNDYETAAYGKILHWDGKYSDVWSVDHFDADWGRYSRREGRFMNASVTPDNTRPEESFKDHELTTSAINTLRVLADKNEYFMLAIGFKLPHVPIHIPYKYFDMYRPKTDVWKRSKRDLTYPSSTPLMQYKCCVAPHFQYITANGTRRTPQREWVNDITKVNTPFTQRMHTELMWGYSAAVTFLDVQLGRVLDVIDNMGLWNNLTVVLTSDHGMHNGEKGIW